MVVKRGIVEANEDISLSKLGNRCIVMILEVIKSGGPFKSLFFGDGRCHDW